MSKPSTTRRVRGIGNVITDESEFSDFDRVAPSRLSARIERADVSDEDAADETPRPRTKNPHVEWLTRPTVPEQAVRMPETVRLGPTVTKVFNLSEPADLEAYNDLHQKAGNADGALVEITANHREFFNGAFYACVAYSPVSYQKL